MPGLLDTLSLGSRAMQTHQKGVAVAGHNLANVNNTAYARQRLDLSTSPAVDTAYGPLGNGVDGLRVSQIRNTILDRNIEVESSARGSLEAQQEALNLAESGLGQMLGDGTSGLPAQLTGLFKAFQDAATNPGSSATRSTLLGKASELASQFQQVNQRLTKLGTSLDQSLQTDVGKVNGLAGEIADLNQQISRAETTDGSTANDLRDIRQQKLEELARYVKVDTATSENGGLEISVAGTTLVSDGEVKGQLETFTSDAGNLLVRAKGSAEALTLAGGRIQGTIEVRDGAVAKLQSRLNVSASRLITEVNALHREGFDLSGNTGADLFTGTGAADIGVNPQLKSDPSKLQFSEQAGASGDGKVALRLAQLAGRPLAELGNETLGGHFNQAIADLGEAAASVERGLADQDAVDNMLAQQRSSVSGVSLDEEMTDLMKFQKAYAASAKLISTVDEMLDAVINLKR